MDYSLVVSADPARPWIRVFNRFIRQNVPLLLLCVVRCSCVEVLVTWAGLSAEVSPCSGQDGLEVPFVFCSGCLQPIPSWQEGKLPCGVSFLSFLKQSFPM